MDFFEKIKLEDQEAAAALMPAAVGHSCSKVPTVSLF